MRGSPRIIRLFGAEPRLVLAFQLLATAAALGWVPGNAAKLAAMVVIWGLCFGRITPAELVVMAGVNVLFAALNAVALERGIFRFDHPDFAGMPVYEYAMWGFYTLHTIRMLGSPPSKGRLAPAFAAAAAFAIPFATLTDPTLLLLGSATLLGVCLALYHEKMDLAYAGYMAAIGALIENVGVGTGQWHYPGPHSGPIPLWFLTMWAGVGLFTRRLVLPLLRPAWP